MRGGTLENEPEGDPKASEAQQPPTAPVIPEGKEPDCQTTTTERDNKTKPPEEKPDRDLVRWTRALAIFTGVLVVASILQFWVMRGQLDEMKATREGGDKSMTDQLAVMRDQAKAMQGQLDEMATAQRPWIVITNQKVGSIWGRAQVGYNATGLFDITNSGHSPAFNVQIVHRLVAIDYAAAQIRPAQAVACNEGIKPEVEKMPGPTVFPNETATISSDGAGISDADVAKYTNRRSADYAQLPLVLTGCVIYQSADGVELHHTPFAFLIEGRIDPTSTVPMVPSDFALKRTWRYGVSD